MFTRRSGCVRCQRSNFPLRCGYSCRLCRPHRLVACLAFRPACRSHSRLHRHEPWLLLQVETCRLTDVFIIALGFLLRVTAGAFAIQAKVSPWLIRCTFFVALFLAICKRRNELVSLGENAASHRGILASYSVVFIDKMVSALASLTIMSYALYTIDPNVVKRLETDGLILTLPIVLFGIFRYLFLVHQKQKGGSPTEVMLKDRSIQLTDFCTLGCPSPLFILSGSSVWVRISAPTGESTPRRKPGLMCTRATLDRSVLAH